MIAYRGPSKRKGFAQIPNVVLLDKSLSHPAKVLYGLMVGYAMQHEAFETDQFAIAEDMGCTDRAIRKWMKELLDAGLLTITRRGLNQPNVYLIEDAYALYDQKKPEPKKAGPVRWDRNNGSGPDRNSHSGPERNAGSGQERNNGSGPYLKGKNLKKEDTKEPFLPSASGEQTRMEKPKTENPKAPDPLTALPAPEYAELEIQARAQLVAETGPPVSLSLLNGQSHRLVKQRMREMLAATGIMKPLDTLRSHSPDTDHPC